jgi:hypothetical protein
MNAKRKEMILAVHRHWIWANRIRETLRDHLLNGDTPKTDEELIDWIVGGSGMYMCLWYGLLFVVCDALRGNRITVPSVQSLINELYAPLGDFRNAMFHVQKKYWTTKMQSIMKDPESPTKIRVIHDGIGEWLLNELKASRVNPTA